MADAEFQEAEVTESVQKLQQLTAALADTLCSGGRVAWSAKLTLGKILSEISDSIFTRVLGLGTEFFPLFLRKVQFHLVIVLKYKPKISSALRAEFPFLPFQTPRGQICYPHF